ncbi:MAG: DUF615 domain-containing protein [Cellvibrionales bacterium]|nr:DUF615 domain-containing protein [Cellvibrionales bacterium]
MGEPVGAGGRAESLREADHSAPSKSQRKRERRQLRDISIRLLELRPEKRAALGLPPHYAESLNAAARLKASGARERQLRHAAKCLAADAALSERLQDLLASEALEARRQRWRQHLVEQWRDRLVAEAGEDSLAAFFADFPAADRQHVRTLVRNARRERAAGRDSSQQRKLFRYLRDSVIL